MNSILKNASLQLRRYPRLHLFAKRIVRRELGTVSSDFRRSPSPPEGAKTVLIYAERYFTIHTAWELTIGKILQQAGYQVLVVGCDRVNSFCDVFHLEKSNLGNCGVCAHYLRKGCKQFGISYISMKEYGEKHGLDWDNEQESDSPFEGAPSYEEIVDCSVTRHLRSQNREDKYRAHTTEKFIQAIRRSNLFWKHFFKHQSVDLVFVLNGQFSNSHLLCLHAEHREIPFLTYERGNRKNTLIFAQNAPVVPVQMKELWQRYNHEELSEFQQKELETYVGTRIVDGNGHVSFFPTIQADQDQIIKELKITSNKPIYLLFSNLIWDSAVYGQDTLFTNMFTWIGETIRFFEKHPELQLIIRAHPAEIRVYWWETREKVSDFIHNTFPQLPSNITVIPADSNISSYVLMDLAKVGIVYTSSTGLEMGLKGKPVIACANSHYEGCGLVHEPHSREAYFELLESPSLEPLTNQVSQIEKYSYLFYFKKMYPFPFVNESNGFQMIAKSPSQLKGASADQLLQLFQEQL